MGGIFCVPGEKMEHARCTTEQREFIKYKMKDETKFLSNFTKRKKGEGNTLKHRGQLKYRKSARTAKKRRRRREGVLSCLWLLLT